MPTNRPATAAPVIVIAPDSFKGSLTARQVADAIGRGVRQAIPDARLHFCPIADGGEGTLDAMLQAGGKTQMITLRDAGGRLREAPVAILPNGTAVIESAEIVGITDSHGMALPVGNRSTEGIGDAIRILLDQGIRSFLIALGGSSTNDGGAGMLCALGLKLYDAAGALLPCGPAALQKLARIDTSGLDSRLAEVSITGMSDVDNPLCGDKGASAVFGPQKGVQPEQIALFDQALAHFAALLEAATGRQAATVAGAGAAGGLGYALLMLGAQLESGAETVCRHIGLDAYLQNADWLITGEGRSDTQTLHGKAPFVAAHHARSFGVNSTLLSGAIDQQALTALQQHFTGCFSIVLGPVSLAQAIAEADQLLQASAWQIAAIWQAGRSHDSH
ncbi:MAG TPA: glycerate kinase [Herbaspirillum sp.]|nr:glycerate kinase [Herbaspirillum sp.]